MLSEVHTVHARLARPAATLLGRLGGRGGAPAAAAGAQPHQLCFAYLPLLQLGLGLLLPCCIVYRQERQQRRWGRGVAGQRMGGSAAGSFCPDRGRCAAPAKPRCWPSCCASRTQPCWLLPPPGPLLTLQAVLGCQGPAAGARPAAPRAGRSPAGCRAAAGRNPHSGGRRLSCGPVRLQRGTLRQGTQLQLPHPMPAGIRPQHPSHHGYPTTAVAAPPGLAVFISSLPCCALHPRQTARERSLLMQPSRAFLLLCPC